MAKIIKSSRAFPLGHFDEWLLPGDCEVFVKKCEKFTDVLVIITDSRYICRYQFPLEYDLEYIYNFFKNGTFQQAPPRSFTAHKEK